MNPQRGFTLIELLVVIAIIAMLASIVLASLNSARAKARDSTRLEELKQLQNALELYATDHNGLYPSDGSWQSMCAAWGSFTNMTWVPGLVSQYISVLPSDPGMTASASTDCFLYYSNGADYKILDYNQTADVNTASAPSYIDRMRNSGASWQVLGECLANGTPGNGNGNGDGSHVWAIWSSQNSLCW